MAAHRIRVTNNNNVLPRCKSEGTLIELDEGVTEASLIDVKGRFGRLFQFVEFNYCHVVQNLAFSLF